MAFSMDEKQRRISRILTIDEIVNPPGSRASASHAKVAQIHVTQVDSVNPSANNNFLRINHGSQVVVQEHDIPRSAGGVMGAHYNNNGSRKNVSFASSTTSTTVPSVR